MQKRLREHPDYQGGQYYEIDYSSTPVKIRIYKPQTREIIEIEVDEPFTEREKIRRIKKRKVR